MAFRDRYTPRARYRRIVLFYRRYYFSHLDIVYWYRPYISVRFHKPWPRIYYYYPKRPALAAPREKKRERDEDREGGRCHYILRDTLNDPPPRVASRRAIHRGILARESSILRGGIGSSLPIARRSVSGVYRVYDFARTRKDGV